MSLGIKYYLIFFNYMNGMFNGSLLRATTTYIRINKRRIQLWNFTIWFW